MSKFANTIANTALGLIIIFFSLILGFDAGKGNGDRFGFVSTVASTVGNMPAMVKELLKPYPDFLRPAQDVPSVNKLEEDVFALHTFGPTNEAKMVNLRTDKVLKTWELGEHKPFPNARYFAQLLEDSALFVYVHEGDWMGVVNAQSEIVWEKQGELVYHHSAQRIDNTIWICARDVEYLHAYGTITLDTVKLNDRRSFGIMDEVMLAVDLQTGHTTDSISMQALFAQNGLNPIYKSYYGPAHGDCFHLNDIEPVTFSDSANNYQYGDLLVSNRTQNELLHIRPETGEILHALNAGLSSQHDVDVVGDTMVVCFNNNAPSLFVGQLLSDNKEHMGTYSNVAAYHLDGTPMPELALSSQMAGTKLYTSTEGLQQYLDNGMVVVEEQNEFTIHIFNGSNIVYQGGLNYFGSEDYVEIPNWTRFYTN